MATETTSLAGATRRDGDLEDAAQTLRELQLTMSRAAQVAAVAELAAAIAHEVNQPLAGIITNAGTCLRMLDGNLPNVEGARETARRTIRDANRASEVVARLRALFPRKALTLEPLDLNDATREVIALASGDLGRNRVVLDAELADDVPSIIGDRVQLQQVILNLVRNASDAMATVHDRPRRLLIRTTHDGDGDRVCVTVQDAGVGLDGETMARLFEPFYSTKPEGLGLGLSVSRSIVQRHQGRLWAEANGGGPGATFSLFLPRLLPTDQNAPAAPTAS